MKFTSTRVPVLLLAAITISVTLQAQLPPYSVLIVVAHPDDDTVFTGTVYRLTHDFGGTADLALISDGSAGYRFSTFAEPIYGLELTDEEVAGQYLPAIRIRELMNGGEIYGLRKYFFLDQPDSGYTEDVDLVLSDLWDTSFVLDRLRHIMEEGDYDFVFVHVPIPSWHGHHKAASILALQAVEMLESGERPVVVGALPSGESFSVDSFEELPGYPITRVSPPEPVGAFDLLQPVGFEGRLNYRIITNWVIAEHKSQGTMQLLMNSADSESYWNFAANPPGSAERIRVLLERLAEDASVTAD